MLSFFSMNCSRDTLAKQLSLCCLAFHHSISLNFVYYVYVQTVGREAGNGPTRRNSMNRSDPKPRADAAKQGGKQVE